jgi:hypothetical protein
LEDSRVTKNEISSNEQVETKSNVVVFFDIKSIVMTEWVPQGQTVNQNYYLKVRSESENEKIGLSYGRTIHGLCIKITRRLIMLYL